MGRSVGNQKLSLFPEKSIITRDFVSEETFRENEHLNLDCRATHRGFTLKSSSGLKNYSPVLKVNNLDHKQVF